MTNFKMSTILLLIDSLICVCWRPAWASEPASSGLSPVDLRCEYLVNPLGIDDCHPRLSWKLAAAIEHARGQGQRAYQVLVASDRDLLDQDRGDLWDSGRVESDQSIHVPYAGNPLESRMQCWWKVRVWDQENQPSRLERTGVLVDGTAPRGRLERSPVDRTG